MPEEKPWGSIDPNSQHQLWSRWTFKLVSPPGLHPPAPLLAPAFKRWSNITFGSVGQAMADEFVHTHTPTGRVTRKGFYLIAEVEGPTAHDPEYQVAVRRMFRHFVDANWSEKVRFDMDVAILAGDSQNGEPPKQLIVLPCITNALG